MVHLHDVRDSDSHFVISPITREITNPNSGKNKLMQGDHNSEVFTFEIPKMVEGHDMTLCNEIRIHYNDISADKANESKDFFLVEDAHIDETHTDTLVFSWLISGNATKYAGLLSFRIQFLCINESGIITYKWHTDVFKGITISDGFENTAAAIEEYTDLIAAWSRQLFGAGNSVMANIDNKAVEHIEAIEGARRAAVAAVEVAGAETLDTIPKDYTELYKMAYDAGRSRANAIVQKVQGEAIVATDCSGDHLRGLKVFGKSEQLKTTGAQLLDFTDGLSSAGVTTVFTNDVLTITGDGTVGYQNVSFDITDIVKNNPGKVLYFNFEKATSDNTVGGAPAQLNIAKNSGAHEYKQMMYNDGSKYPFSIPSDTSDIATVYFALYTNNDYAAVVNKRTITKPMLQFGNDALEYEPYSGGIASPSPEYPQEIHSVGKSGTVEIEVHGKNLLGMNGSYKSTYSNYVLNATVENGAVSVSGKSMLGYGTLQVSLPLGVFKKGETYRISRVNENFHVGFWFYDKNNANVGTLTTENALHFTIPESADHMTFFYAGLTPETEVELTEKFMLNLGTEALPWEPYVQRQALTIHNTLHGVPVSSGGNYTDANGQQWICDEVDLARGVYVKRIGVTDLTDAEWSQNSNGKYFSTKDRGVYSSAYRVLCSHINGGTAADGNGENVIFVNANNDIRLNITLENNTTEAAKNAMNGAILVGVLATPIETALTDAEIVAFKALRSNYPNTTVLNDAGAWMEVAYNADTNAYIKNMRKVRTVDVELLASAWVETEYSNMWAQEIKISGSTKYTKVKLSPTIKQIAVFYGKHLAFDTETVDGVITAYAIGQKPMNDYVIQAEVTEVSI